MLTESHLPSGLRGAIERVITFTRSIQHLERGDHACLVYDSDERRKSAVLAFTADGLRSRERVLCVSQDADELAAWLTEAHPAAEAALAGGQLIVMAVDDVYLTGGGFDAERMLERLREAAAEARADGFAGFRIVGDADWGASEQVSRADLLDYEDRVDAVLRASRITALCHYHRQAFDEVTLRETQRLHPLVLGDERGGKRHGHELLVEPAEHGVLVLRGEVDVSNCDSLRRSLAGAAARRRRVRVDVRQLSFIDAAGLRAISDAADRLAGRAGELVLISPGPFMSRLLALSGLDRMVVIEQVR